MPPRPSPRSVGDRDEAQRRVLQRQGRDAVAVLGRDLDDLRPPRRHLVGVLALDLGRGDRPDHRRADGLVPGRPGRAPAPVRHVAVLLLVDLEERAAGVGRVELDVGEAVLVELADDADPELLDARPPGRVVVALRDDHVAAVAVAAVEVALGRRALADRADDLEELRAHRDDDVVQAEPADVRVPVADLEAEHGPDVVEDGVEVAGDERDLAEAQPHGRHRPSNTGVRFSRKARKASRQSADWLILMWASVSIATRSANDIPSAAT